MLQLTDTKAYQISFATRHQRRVFGICFQITDLSGLHRNNLAAFTHQYAFQRCLRRLTGLNRCLGEVIRQSARRLQHTLYCCVEAFAGEGFQQIINRIQLIRGQRVLIVSSRQYHHRAMLNLAQHIQSGQFRHLYIQQHQIRFQRIDHLLRLQTIFYLAAQLQFRPRHDRIAQGFARQRFIFGNQHTQGFFHHCSTNQIRLLFLCRRRFQRYRKSDTHARTRCSADGPCRRIPVFQRKTTLYGAHAHAGGLRDLLRITTRAVILHFHP